MALPVLLLPAFFLSSPPPVTIAVISDLHLAADAEEIPPPRARRAIAAVLAAHPSFVVITGDFTNGEPDERRGQVRFKAHAWNTVRKLLQPLRDAGIPVLPVAGNHDSYLPGQRDHYAATFADLDAWAAPLTVNRSPLAPFDYSIDVGRIHLSFAHLVDMQLRPEVGAFLATDLASPSAAAADVRIVFAHVPFSSVMAEPNAHFAARVGGLLAAGGADLYVSGHEHMEWDEDVRLPDGSSIRQIIVGPATGGYNFGPSGKARRRAGCHRVAGDRLLHCAMPKTGLPFALMHKRLGGYRQTQRASFTLLTIDGTSVTTRIVAIGDKGRTEPFGSR